MSRKPIIVFEGIEASGKSHHISVVAKHLKNKKISFIKLREPGGSQNSEIIRRIILNKKINQAYIFNGTRGVGKTSIARILTKVLNCKNPKNGEPCNECDQCLAMNENSLLDFQEIDAASRRSREETMNLLETVPLSLIHI